VNVAIVRGRLSSLPRKTELGSGDVLVRYEVTVRHDEGPADSVPVCWVGAPNQAPPELERGEEVVAVGRIRRRWFQAGGAAASRTELAATTVVPASRRAAVRKALERAADALSA
jgi:single-strand DNA-binding protein